MGGTILFKYVTNCGYFKRCWISMRPFVWNRWWFMLYSTDSSIDYNKCLQLCHVRNRVSVESINRISHVALSIKIQYDINCDEYIRYPYQQGHWLWRALNAPLPWRCRFRMAITRYYGLIDWTASSGCNWKLWGVNRQIIGVYPSRALAEAMVTRTGRRSHSLIIAHIDVEAEHPKLPRSPVR